MSKPTVFIVDDDEGSLKSLAFLVQSVGHSVKTFASAEAFLESWDGVEPGCVVLDVRMPGISGLTLQEKLSNLDYCPPIIFITGHGDIPMSVHAIKSGAIDFFQKPVNDQLLLDRISEAIQKDSETRQAATTKQEIKNRIERLTPREYEVMELLIIGCSLKEIAKRFGISVQTASKHRTNVLDKLQVQNDVELVHQANQIGLHPAEASSS